MTAKEMIESACAKMMALAAAFNPEKDWIQDLNDSVDDICEDLHQQLANMRDSH